MKLNKERVIEINEEFTIEMSGRIIKKIYEMSMADATGKIVIIINSGGGRTRALKSIIAALNATNCEIITITMGTFAASCAAILFLQGSQRIMLTGSELLFHEPYNRQKPNTVFSYTEISEMYEEAKEEYEFIVTEIMKKTNLSKEEVAEKIKKQDYILNSKEALEIGAATKVIEEFYEIDSL